MLAGRRLAFIPNAFEGLLGAKPWLADVDRIVGISREPKGGSVLVGGTRERLRLHLADGEIQVFLVRGLDRVEADLRKLISPG